MNGWMDRVFAPLSIFLLKCHGFLLPLKSRTSFQFIRTGTMKVPHFCIVNRNHTSVFQIATMVKQTQKDICASHRWFYTYFDKNIYWQGRFLKLAVTWAATRGQCVNGDPGLCALLGRCLWNEGDMGRGTRYLVLGERPQELSDLIVQDVLESESRYGVDRSGDRVFFTFPFL